MHRTSQTPPSVAGCWIRKLLGLGLFVCGTGLTLTLWLLPLGLPAALFGLALMTPGEHC